MTQQAWFCHPHDLVDERVETVLDTMQSGGATGVVLAALYHSGRDITPHSPAGRIRFLRGGVHYYRADRTLYRECGLMPDDAHGLAEPDPLETARAATRERGMDLSAWLVLFHSSRLGTAYPDTTRVTAYGDRVLTDLCPAHPKVQAYAGAVARDVARYEPDRLHLESMHHGLLGHGYHHERYLVDLTPWAAFALGLCFCTHCLAAAQRLGCDTDAVRSWAVSVVEASIAGASSSLPSGPLDREELGAQAGGELAAYLESRTASTSAAVREVADALRGTGVRSVYVDQAGALAGYADGRPTGPAAADIAWQLGIEPRQVASLCDEYAVCGYAVDPARVEADLAAYTDVLPPGASLRVALRAGPPDCPDTPHSEADLERKIGQAVRAGATWIDFYHYGLVSISAVERAGRVWSSRGATA